MTATSDAKEFPDGLSDKGLSDKDKATLLMSKYALLKQEIFNAISTYRSHVQYFQITITGLLAVVGFSFTTGGSVLISSRLFWVLLMFSVTTVVSYVVFVVFDALFHVIALGTRLASIESQINRLANEKLLLWESSLVGVFFGGRFEPVKGVWHPDYLLAGYIAILIGSGLFVPPGFVAYKFWTGPPDHLIWLRILVVIGFAYSLASAVLILKVGRGVTIGFRKGAQNLVQSELSR